MSENVSAKVICDSVNPYGTRITTFELEYPRIIHSELMTHRVFSRNSASSRAIPVNKVIELVETNPAYPEHWGKNQPGMQADNELDPISKESVKQLWFEAAKQAASIAKVMSQSGAHKQVVNRILEPFQRMKVVVTATSYDNWFWLRNHKDADPTIKVLAEKMLVAINDSVPLRLEPGEWHTPYVERIRTYDDELLYVGNDDTVYTVEQALKVSASCCAQTSYRKQDESLEKAEDIYKKLVESEPCHASPVEHQALCFSTPHDKGVFDRWKGGITHMDSSGNYYSGNFKDFIQYRQLIPNNAKDSWI